MPMLATFDTKCKRFFVLPCRPCECKGINKNPSHEAAGIGIEKLALPVESGLRLRLWSPQSSWGEVVRRPGTAYQNFTVL